MTDARRLFVGGLFTGINTTDLTDRFKSFGALEDIDIHVKKDLEGEVVKTFAYVNIKGDEKNFKKCISVLNKSKWKGSELHLEIAKESFLSKLKKEQAVKEQTVTKLCDTKALKTKKTRLKTERNVLLGRIVPKVTKPNQNTWVRGKAGKLVPILNIKPPYSRKLLRHDPTKNPKGVQKLDIGGNKNTNLTSVKDLTWNIEETQHEIYKNNNSYIDVSSSDNDENIGKISNMNPAINFKTISPASNATKNTHALRETCYISSESEIDISGKQNMNTNVSTFKKPITLNQIKNNKMSEVINITESEDSDVNVIGFTHSPGKNKNMNQKPLSVIKRSRSSLQGINVTPKNKAVNLNKSTLIAVSSESDDDNFVHSKNSKKSRCDDVGDSGVVSFVSDEEHTAETLGALKLNSKLYHSSSDSESSDAENEMYKNRHKKSKIRKKNYLEKEEQEDVNRYMKSKNEKQVGMDNSSSSSSDESMSKIEVLEKKSPRKVTKLCNENIDSDSESDVPDIENWVGKKRNCDVVKENPSLKTVKEDVSNPGNKSKKNTEKGISNLEKTDQKSKSGIEKVISHPAKQSLITEGDNNTNPHKKIKNSVENGSSQLEKPADKSVFLSNRKRETELKNKQEYNSDSENNDNDSDTYFVGNKYFQKELSSKTVSKKGFEPSTNLALNLNRKYLDEFAAVLDGVEVQAKTSDFEEDEEDILDSIAANKWNPIKLLGSSIKTNNKVDEDIKTKKSRVSSPNDKDKKSSVRKKELYNSDLDSSDSNESEGHYVGGKRLKKNCPFDAKTSLATKNSTKRSLVQSRNVRAIDEFHAGLDNEISKKLTSSSSSDEEMDILDSIAAGKWSKIKQLKNELPVSKKTKLKSCKNVNTNSESESNSCSKEKVSQINNSIEKVSNNNSSSEKINKVKSAKGKLSQDSQALVQNSKSPHKVESTNLVPGKTIQENKRKHEASNKQRLGTIREKAKQVQAQKSLIQKALSTVDGGQKNKKILFDSDSENEEENIISQKAKKLTESSKKNMVKVKEKPVLFVSDDEDSSEEESGPGDDGDDDTERFKIKPQFEGKHGTKLMELQTRFMNDQRFKLDTRFAESDSDSESGKVETTGEKSEKQKNLEVLEKVMGKKIGTFAAKDKQKKTFKDVNILSYDPTSEDHAQFEIKTEQKKKIKESKKEKASKDTLKNEATEEEPTVEVSKERFYKVSDSLKDLFQKGDTKEKQEEKDEENENCDGGEAEGEKTQSQPFSLLNIFGTDIEDRKRKQNALEGWKPLSNSSTPWESNYNSSDDEKMDDIINHAESTDKNESLFPVARETFFFTTDDPRIKEGVDFFSRKQPIEQIRRIWLQKRPDLVDAYKLKRKRAMRKKRDMQKFQARFHKKRKFFHKK